VTSVSSELTRRLAELVVSVGVSVQPGQDVVVLGWDVEHAPIVRAVAECAYLRGARYVSALYWDAPVKHSRLQHAPAETLGFVPDWWEAITAECIARQSAVVFVHGFAHPRLFDDVAPERMARDVMPITPPFWQAADRGEIAWTVVPGPCPGVARGMLGEPDTERLWELLAPILRLDAPDPALAWRRHLAGLRARAALLDERAFAGLRFRGGGTDLTIRLLPRARWLTVESRTNWGSSVVFNMPSEEVFTTPDHRHTEGVVRITRPLQLSRGGRTEGLVLRFAEGRIVEVTADHGAEFVRAQLNVDPGAARLGEVALVDGSSPVGQSGMVFGDGLIDENATSHIAWGDGFISAVPELPPDRDAQIAGGFNRSDIHQDAMIGGPDVDVLGLDDRGAEIPVILGDRWVLS
jgi:aminopeptidase